VGRVVLFHADGVRDPSFDVEVCLCLCVFFCLVRWCVCVCVVSYRSEVDWGGKVCVCMGAMGGVISSFVVLLCGTISDLCKSCTLR